VRIHFVYGGTSSYLKIKHLVHTYLSWTMY